MCHCSEGITVPVCSLDRHIDGIAQLRSTLDQRMKHVLKITRRAADDAQNLTRCGLLLTSLREVPLQCFYYLVFSQFSRLVLMSPHGGFCCGYSPCLRIGTLAACHRTSQ